jgi:hypothetical protein
MKSNLFSTTALVIGIAILINLLAYEYHVRLDLTEDKKYTLSKATRDILENLEEPVTVKAYFSKDLPPNIIRTREDFQDLLSVAGAGKQPRYGSLSTGYSLAVLNSISVAEARSGSTNAKKK